MQRGPNACISTSVQPPIAQAMSVHHTDGMVTHCTTHPLPANQSPIHSPRLPSHEPWRVRSYGWCQHAYILHHTQGKYSFPYHTSPANHPVSSPLTATASTKGTRRSPTMSFVSPSPSMCTSLRHCVFDMIHHSTVTYLV